MRDLPVVLICRRPARLRCRANHWPFLARPVPDERGVSRSSRRLARDAMDASTARDECGDARTAKPCGPDAPTLASSLRDEHPAGDGGNKARSPGRARNKPSNRRAGNAGSFGVPVVANSCVFFYTRGCGCVVRPAFPAPSLSEEGHEGCKARAFPAAGMLSHIPSAVVPRESGASSIPETSRLKHNCLWNTGSPGQAGRRHRNLLVGNLIKMRQSSFSRSAHQGPMNFIDALHYKISVACPLAPDTVTAKPVEGRKPDGPCK
jgi:hypothetical protein